MKWIKSLFIHGHKEEKVKFQNGHICGHCGRAHKDYEEGFACALKCFKQLNKEAKK